MIDLATLKTEIEENTFNSKLLICKCKDITSKFIAEQYLHYYARANNFEIVEREDIEYSRNTWGTEESCVFIHKTDELTVKPTTEDNIWIITSKIKAKLAKELAEYIVEIPKLEEWQLKDYVATSCRITEELAEQLMEAYKDIYKLDIEINKLKIFSQNMFNELTDQLLYQVDQPIFDLTNALVKRDKQALTKFIESGTEVDPFALTSLLLKNFRNIINIQLAQNPTAESTGLTGKQFYAIQRYSCGHYNREELLYIYSVLTQIDSQIKSGNLDTSHVINYIIGKFLIIIR